MGPPSLNHLVATSASKDNGNFHCGACEKTDCIAAKPVVRHDAEVVLLGERIVDRYRNREALNLVSDHLP